MACQVEEPTLGDRRGTVRSGQKMVLHSPSTHRTAVRRILLPTPIRLGYAQLAGLSLHGWPACLYLLGAFTSSRLSLSYGQNRLTEKPVAEHLTFHIALAGLVRHRHHRSCRLPQCDSAIFRRFLRITGETQHPLSLRVWPLKRNSQLAAQVLYT